MKIKANDGKTYEVPDNPVWHSGPPPETGWWPASRTGNKKFIRWYDKSKDTWSSPAFLSDTEEEAAEWANEIDRGPGIKWTDRWWLKGGK